jgi:DNA-binding MarR family transcriptional regulator
MRPDHVDRLVAQWSRHQPSLDVSSLEVLGRVLRAAAHVERAREAALSAHGLSLGDFDVLATLRRAGGQSGVNPKELAGSALITSGAMTSRLDRLQAAGLVERHPDPADRRAVRVRLTPAGRKAADRALADVLAAHENLLEPLTGRDREATAAALRKMLLACGDS